MRTFVLLLAVTLTVGHPQSQGSHFRSQQLQAAQLQAQRLQALGSTGQQPPTSQSVVPQSGTSHSRPSHLQPPRFKAPQSQDPHSRVPQPHIPQPHVPQSHAPQSHVPQPHVPEPHVPEPHVPEPHVPEPQVPPFTAASPQAPHPQNPGSATRPQTRQRLPGQFGREASISWQPILAGKCKHKFSGGNPPAMALDTILQDCKPGEIREANTEVEELMVALSNLPGDFIVRSLNSNNTVNFYMDCILKNKNCNRMGVALRSFVSQDVPGKRGCKDCTCCEAERMTYSLLRIFCEHPHHVSSLKNHLRYDVFSMFISSHIDCSTAKS